MLQLYGQFLPLAALFNHNLVPTNEIAPNLQRHRPQPHAFDSVWCGSIVSRETTIKIYSHHAERTNSAFGKRVYPERKCVCK